MELTLSKILMSEAKIARYERDPVAFITEVLKYDLSESQKELLTAMFKTIHLRQKRLRGGYYRCQD